MLACSDAIAVPWEPKRPWRERKESHLRHLVAETSPEVLVVSACDKLHNARSLVTDLRTDGPVIWQRFSQPDPAAQLWYYQSLADTCAARIPPALQDELTLVVRQLKSLASNATDS